MAIDRRFKRGSTSVISGALTVGNVLEGDPIYDETLDTFYYARGVAPGGVANRLLAQASQSWAAAQISAAVSQAGSLGVAGTVATPSDLPGTVTDGKGYSVKSTQSIWTGVSGVWTDSGVGVVVRGAPQASSLLTQITADISAATSSAFKRLVRRLATTTTDTAVVLLIGDSITEGADQVGYGTEDTYALRLQRWFEQHFGSRVRVVDYALGQRRIDHFNDPNYKALATEPASIDSGFGPRVVGDRPWTVGQVGKSWQQVAMEVGADLVVLAFGMNQDVDANGDANYVQRGYFLNVINTIQTTWNQWEGLTPDVLLVSPQMPVASFPKTPTQMRGMGTMQRGVARDLGLPIADVNRISNLNLYGFDPESRTSRAWLTIAANLTGWTDTGTASWVHQSDNTYNRAASNSTGYMQLDSAQFMDGELRLFAAFSSDTELLNLNFRTGAWGQIRVQWTGNTVQVFEIPTAGGVQRTLGGRTGSPTLAAGGTWAGAGQSLYLYAEGTRLRLTHGGVDVPLQDSALGLQPTTVQVGTLDSGYVLPSKLIGVGIIPRDPIQAAGNYTSKELLGALSNSGGQASGNNLNHPTGTGYALSYHAAITAALSSLPARVAGALAASVNDQTTITPTYAANWSDLGGYVPMRVTKRGNRVEMAGNSQRSAGAESTALTLPVGYRPPTSYLLRVTTNAGLLVATVQADGQIVFADAVPDGGWVAWSGVEWLTS